MGLQEALALADYRPADVFAVDYSGWKASYGGDHTFVHWNGPPVRDTAAGGDKRGEKAQLRAVEDYHRNSKGWAGFAYDFAVGQSGAIYVGRGGGRSAATSGDYDGDGIPNNAESEAIFCILGEGQEPSDEMLASLSELCDALGAPVVAHRDTASTSCPGDALAAWVARYDQGGEQAATPPAPPAPSRPDNEGWFTMEVTLPVLKIRAGYESKAEQAPVKRLQHLLAANGHSNGGADGKFGGRTFRSVVAFQRQAKIKPDGVVGPVTWGKLLGQG